MVKKLFRFAAAATLMLLLLVVVFLVIPGLGRVDDPGLEPAFDQDAASPPPRSTASLPNPQRTAFFGDLHVHTSFSTDAYIFGVRTLPEDAYIFAKGGTIEHGAGYPIRLSQPLDFLAVTDHAEYLGTARAASPDIPTSRKQLRALLKTGNRFEFTKYWLQSVIALTGKGFGFVGANPEVEASAWSETIAAAERHNDPGFFTAFIGYEWSSLGIHRNVVYGSGEVAARPFSSIDSNQPQDLWRELESQNEAGQSVIAIPHNMNESGGRMYPADAIEELVWTSEEAMLRRRIEPVSEIYQIKGTSETHPKLSPRDPFADFEIVDLPGYRGGKPGAGGAYARDALRTGLEIFAAKGWNPYVFGFVGSTDSHNASSPVEENKHHGKLPLLDGSAAIRSGEAILLPRSQTPGGTWGGGGLAGIWAEENTRSSLFSALRRRETFATSGPRIAVRLFGGWGLEARWLEENNPAARAYAAGVPMGADLPPRENDAAPRFLLWALKDPAAAHLDRLQIIKGWVDASGESFERVYDLAASGGREIDPASGFYPPVGSTVDIADASYTNTIGSTTLKAYWIDPDFDPTQSAFYYARVLEIPTPRMSTYDAKTLGIDAPEPATIQERAATSAIFYWGK